MLLVGSLGSRITMPLCFPGNQGADTSSALLAYYSKVPNAKRLVGTTAP
jgi:hypothetical protein